MADKLATVHIKADLRDRLKIESVKRHTSIEVLIEKAVTEYLTNYEK